MLFDSLLAPLLALAQASAPAQAPTSAEERTARRLESIRGDPVALRAFLRALPKGGDLHSHVSGAIYAESYLWAAEDGLCIETQSLTIASDREPCDAAKGQRAAKDAGQAPTFHDALVDAKSCRQFDLRAGRGARRPGGRGGPDPGTPTGHQFPEGGWGYARTRKDPAASRRRSLSKPTSDTDPLRRTSACVEGGLSSADLDLPRLLIQRHPDNLADGRRLLLLRRAQAQRIEDALDGNPIADIGDDLEFASAGATCEGVSTPSSLRRYSLRASALHWARSPSSSRRLRKIPQQPGHGEHDVSMRDGLEHLFA